MNRISLFAAAVLIALCLIAPTGALATVYTWANSNFTGNPPATLDWFAGGPNTLGLWTGDPADVPVSAGDTTIQVFENNTTALYGVKSTTLTQTCNINNGGAAFQLAALTLLGKSANLTGAVDTVIISGDAMNFSGASGTITFDAVKSTASGSNIIYKLNSEIQLGTAGSACDLTLTGDGDGTFQLYVISELQTGGGGVVKTGSCASYLYGDSTYTGMTTVEAGMLQIGGNSSSTDYFGSVAGSITVNGGTVALGRKTNGFGGSLIINGGSIKNACRGTSEINITRPMIWNGEFSVVNGAGEWRVQGSISLGDTGPAGARTVTVNANAPNFICGYGGNGSIADGTATSLVKAGGGTMSLRSANTYSVPTVVSEGTLAIGHVNALQNSTLDTGPAGAQVVTFTISGAKTYNLGGLQGTDDLAIGVNTVSVGANGSSTTFSGVIGPAAAAGSLVKVGAGTLTLANTNLYAGGTVVTGGKLVADNAAALGTGPVTVGDGAALALGSSVTGVATGALEMQAGSIFACAIAAGAIDKLTITGDLTLDDAWTVRLVDAGGTPQAATQYELFTYTGDYMGLDVFGPGSIDATGTGWSTSGATIINDSINRRVYMVGLAASSGPSCDTNADGVVDAADYITLKRNFGQIANSGPSYGDVNSSGTTDWNDLQILMGAMGGAGSGAPATTPEPATLCLLAMGALAALRRRAAR